LLEKKEPLVNYSYAEYFIQMKNNIEKYTLKDEENKIIKDNINFVIKHFKVHHTNLISVGILPKIKNL
ncbi:MAG: hypothetical protein ACXWDO_07790, partial [Bacteroidia bacterium]